MIAQGVSAPLADRWRRALPLLLPTLGGLAYLHTFGAPAQAMIVNAGALCIGLAWVLAGRLPSAPEARPGAGVWAAATAGLLLVPLVTGPSLEGASRWFPAGPVMLQSGPLLLPLIVVLAAPAPRSGAAVLALAGAALALQPDAAGLAALALASGVLAALHRSPGFAAVAVGAAAGAALTFSAGPLAPVLHTEGVLAHVAQRSVAATVGLGLVLLGAPLWFLVIRPALPRAEGRALAALIIGFSLMAMLGPFPFPLIGYGAAPILGFAIALGAAAHFPPRA